MPRGDGMEVASQPLVTVVIPARDVAGYIGAALDSICTQDYTPFEVLVVDDGSTDGTPDVVTRFGDNRVRLLQNEGRGIADGFNTGLKHARGVYLLRCDADDWFMPERISRQVAWMEAHPDVGVCAGVHETCWEDGRVVLEAPVDQSARSLRDQILTGGAVPRTIDAIYRTECLRAVGGCRAFFTTCEDDDLVIRLAERFDVWCVPERVYRVRLRKSSICRTTSRAELQWFVEQCHAFRVQRREQGRDDLQRGTPPAVPTEFPHSRPRPAEHFAQDYLIGDGWRCMQRGETSRAFGKFWQAVRFAPLRRNGWRNLFAALVAALRGPRRTDAPSIAD